MNREEYIEKVALNLAQAIFSGQFQVRSTGGHVSQLRRYQNRVTGQLSLRGFTWRKVQVIEQNPDTPYGRAHAGQQVAWVFVDRNYYGVVEDGHFRRLEGKKCLPRQSR